jgi:hypothetical protein
MNLREKAIEIRIEKDCICFVLSDEDYEEWWVKEADDCEIEVCDDYDRCFYTNISDAIENYLDEIGIVVGSKSMYEVI